MTSQPFADRLLAAVEKRGSQVCLGLDPDPAALLPDAAGAASTGGSARERAGRAVEAHCRLLVDRAGEHCVAVKLQLACFERLGPPGWAALEDAVTAAREAGLVVIADGKRGDVPVTAAAYGQALVGETQSPWGAVPGLGVDAFTANPLLGSDALEPLVEAAAAASAGLFVLVRTSNPGASEIQDLACESGPVHERLAGMVAAASSRLAGECGLSGMGAVVGATRPEHLRRLRDLMPEAIMLLPGVGAQGGRPEDLADAFRPGPAGALVTASRSIAGAADPGAAARELREAVLAVSGGRAG